MKQLLKKPWKDFTIWKGRSKILSLVSKKLRVFKNSKTNFKRRFKVFKKKSKMVAQWVKILRRQFNKEKKRENKWSY